MMVRPQRHDDQIRPVVQLALLDDARGGRDLDVRRMQRARNPAPRGEPHVVARIAAERGDERLPIAIAIVADRGDAQRPARRPGLRLAKREILRVQPVIHLQCVAPQVAAAQLGVVARERRQHVRAADQLAVRPTAHAAVAGPFVEQPHALREQQRLRAARAGELQHERRREMLLFGMRPDHVGIEQRGAIAPRMHQIEAERVLQRAAADADEPALTRVTRIRQRELFGLRMVIAVQAAEIVALAVGARIRAVKQMNVNLRGDHAKTPARID